MGIYMLCFLGGTPLGSPLLGWLAGVYGPRSSLLIGGVVSAVAGIVCVALLMRAHHLRPTIDHGRIGLHRVGV